MIARKCKLSPLYVLTSLFLLLLIAFLLTYSFQGIFNDQKNLVLHSLVFGLVLFTLVYGIIYTPRQITMQQDALIIHFLFFKRIIKREAISDIREGKGNKMDVRMLGISGLFGKIGLFYSRSFDTKYRAYSTNANNSFYVFQKNNKVLELSCEDSQSILEYWRTLEAQDNSTMEKCRT